MGFLHRERYDISDLLSIMEMLRDPDKGCPWDSTQTHKSIRKDLLEETYEAAEAIDNEDTELLREELGDVLLQVVFHAQMEREAGTFDFADVCNDVCKKLIIRHPHIFGTGKADTPEEVLDNWDAIKRREKHQETITETLHSVPKTFPALMRAQKVQKRAAKAGFDYPDAQGAVQDMHSELDELEQALAQKDKEAVLEEVGDLLFSVVNVSRFAGTDAEYALTLSSEKFIARFAQVEQLARERNIDMKQADIQVLDSLWNEAKKRI